MKIVLRKLNDKLMAYIPKKDLEIEVINQTTDGEYTYIELLNG
ncbi:MAG: NifT/FixU family protein [Hydrogenothermaceae bacterium]|nr:NifT/FixU family protein [Hydrogenothermaceae bacterium]